MKYPNIEAERARSGMTKEKFASTVGVSVGTVKNWQNGRTEIPASKIIVMAKIFNVTTDYLLGRPDQTAEGQEVAWNH